MDHLRGANAPGGMGPGSGPRDMPPGAPLVYQRKWTGLAPPVGFFCVRHVLVGVQWALIPACWGSRHVGEMRSAPARPRPARPDR